MHEESDKAREIDLGTDFGDVVVTANGIRIELHADGSVDAYTSSAVKVHPVPANDSASEAVQEIGAVEQNGRHKGEIYGGILPDDGRPIWFSTAPRLMDHFKAAAWAEGQGGSLPTRKQGDYLTTLKAKGGAFAEIFNRGDSFPAGYVWLAEPDTDYRNGAWCQRLGDGDYYSFNRNLELPVLGVFR